MSESERAPLWAPWRMEYVLGPKNKDGCVFCVANEIADDEAHARLIVWRSVDVIVMLNRYPFASGHLLVIPCSHRSHLEDLSGDENHRLWSVVRESVVRLKRAVSCDGVNVGLNLGPSAGAGIAEHLHVHVVPRWNGDTNFMPVVADVRVVPQALDKTRAHLETFFADLA
jgi:ATP adenylyltransferase